MGGKIEPHIKGRQRALDNTECKCHFSHLKHVRFVFKTVYPIELNTINIV